MAPPEPILYYAAVIRRKDNFAITPTLELSKQYWLTSFNRFLHGNYKEALTFLAQTFAERTGPGIRQDITEEDKHCYTYGTSVGVCAVVITSNSYPSGVAFAILSKIVDEFTSQHPKTSYMNLVKDPERTEDPIAFKYLKDHIQEWQKPGEIPGLASIDELQRNLDDTKDVLRRTMESVLERGEKIDNLVAKSDALSSSSKMFYTQAKKQNSCCVVM